MLLLLNERAICGTLLLACLCSGCAKRLEMMTKAGGSGAAAAAALSWREATDRLTTEGRQAFGPSELVTARQPTKTVRPSLPPFVLLPFLLLDPVPQLLSPTWKSLFKCSRKPTAHLQSRQTDKENAQMNHFKTSFLFILVIKKIGKPDGRECVAFICYCLGSACGCITLRTHCLAVAAAHSWQWPSIMNMSPRHSKDFFVYAIALLCSLFLFFFF